MGLGTKKGYTETGEWDYLQDIRPGRAPDLTDATAQGAARDARMRVGRNRRATFLTGVDPGYPAADPRELGGGRTILGGLAADLGDGATQPERSMSRRRRGRTLLTREVEQ